MYWDQLTPFMKVMAVVVTVIAFGSIFYAFAWGRISWLPPRKK